MPLVIPTWGFEIFDPAVRMALLFELCRQIAMHAEILSRLSKPFCSF
jgi:hypothetical protein